MLIVEPDEDVQPGTAEDLLADAARRRLPASRRLITDYVSKGLLGSPHHASAGRSRGSHKGVYSANQRLLWRTLISWGQVEPSLARRATLPLFLWAHYGDDHVRTPQACRALRTALHARTTSRERAAKAAKDYVEKVAHADADATAKTRMRRLLADAMTTGRLNDPTYYNRTFARVFDPHGVGRRFLPPIPMAISATPDQFVAAMVRREHAAIAFLDGKVTHDTMEAVRQHLQVSLVAYARHNPLYVALSAQRLVDVVREHEMQSLLTGILGNVLLVLGHVLATGVAEPVVRVQVQVVPPPGWQVTHLSMEPVYDRAPSMHAGSPSVPSPPSVRAR